MSSLRTGWDGVERKFTRWLFRYRWRIMTIWCLVFSLAVAYAVHENRVNADRGKEAADAICTLKADYRHRIQQGEDYLRENPHGFPGLTAVAIRSNIENQKRTLRSLKIKC